jgi:hypothetical protein
LIRRRGGATGKELSTSGSNPKQYLKPETAGMNASSSMHCMVSPIAVALLDEVSRPSHKPCTIFSTVSFLGVLEELILRTVSEGELHRKLNDPGTRAEG